MKKVCVFDVNETLLDLAALDPEFERVFGDKAVRKEWFGQFMVSMLVATVTDAYRPFGEIGAAAFDMIAEKRGVTVSQEDKGAILSKIASLPPHPEVAASLARLKDNGFMLATLTNSTPEVAEKQLQNSNLSQYFDKILSADSIKQLKPAKEVYEMAKSLAWKYKKYDLWLLIRGILLEHCMPDVRRHLWHGQGWYLTPWWKSRTLRAKI